MVSALPEKVIAVMAYGRGGSGLWSSLLDSHPSILTFPDCMIMDFYSFWDRCGHLNNGEIAEHFVRHYSVAFDARQGNSVHFSRFPLGEHLGLTSMGPNRNERIEVDLMAFKRALSHLLDFSASGVRKVFFQAAHVAYAEALGRRIGENSIISFGLHVANSVDLQRLLDDFPRTVFIQTIREPVIGMAAWFRHFSTTEQVIDPDLFLRAQNMAFDTAQPGPPGYESRWFAVRLEDVHNHPEVTLRQVAGFLGLEWDPILLESTFNGKKWWNEKKSLQISGFDARILRQSLDEYLTKCDRRRLQVALSQRAKAWGYRRTAPSFFDKLFFFMTLLLPFRMEQICRRVEKIHNARGSIIAGFLRPLRRYMEIRKKLVREVLFASRRAEAAIISSPEIPLPQVSGAVLLELGGSTNSLLDQARTLLDEALTLIAHGAFINASEKLDHAIRCAPNIVALYAAQGQVYENLGQIEKANSFRARAGLPPLSAAGASA